MRCTSPRSVPIQSPPLRSPKYTAGREVRQAHIRTERLAHLSGGYVIAEHPALLMKVHGFVLQIESRPGVVQRIGDDLERLGRRLKPVQAPPLHDKSVSVLCKAEVVPEPVLVHDGPAREGDRSVGTKSTRPTAPVQDPNISVRSQGRIPRADPDVRRGPIRLRRRTNLVPEGLPSGLVCVRGQTPHGPSGHKIHRIPPHENSRERGAGLSQLNDPSHAAGGHLHCGFTADPKPNRSIRPRVKVFHGTGLNGIRK